MISANDMAVKVLRIKREYKLDITEDDIVKAVNDYLNTELSFIDERNIKEIDIFDYSFKGILKELVPSDMVEEIISNEKDKKNYYVQKEIADEIKLLRQSINENAFIQRGRWGVKTPFFVTDIQYV